MSSSSEKSRVRNPSIASGLISTGSAGNNATSSDFSLINSTGDLPTKIRKGVGRLSENMHILANDPSLALFCLQEHIRKEVPNMIKESGEFSQQHRVLQGTCYDIDYSIGAVKSIEKSSEQFESISNHLKNALFLKQQLKFEENRKKAQTRRVK